MTESVERRIREAEWATKYVQDERDGLAAALADAKSALEDIASGDWQRYPYREAHGQTTVQDYARYVAARLDGSSE